jgi:hypothetical protein
VFSVGGFQPSAVEIPQLKFYSVQFNQRVIANSQPVSPFDRLLVPYQRDA